MNIVPVKSSSVLPDGLKFADCFVAMLSKQFLNGTSAHYGLFSAIKLDADKIM